MKFLITIFQDEDGIYIAECPQYQAVSARAALSMQQKRIYRRQSRSVLRYVQKKGCLLLCNCHFVHRPPGTLLRSK